MANTYTKCTYQVQWSVFFYLVFIFVVGTVLLFGIGGMMYEGNRNAKAIHEENECEVMASDYYESTCSGNRGSTYVCFRPFWLVSYSVFEVGTETRINASIEEAGWRTTAAAKNHLNQYQIGMSYTCWCNVIDTSKARWDEPNTFNGMMLLIFGGVSTILCFVGIFFCCRARKNMHNEK